MSEPNRWRPGAAVVWRSVLPESVAAVLATVVIEDTPDAIALYQPQGAPRKQRTGLRGGPSGRNMLPDGWDGGYQDAAWPGPPVVRLHLPGTGYSVIRPWNAVASRFQGWYVNLEQPWVRTAIGFDSLDDVLDIQLADDLSTWHWKDEDELDWSVDVGKVSAAHAAEVRRAGEAAITLIEARQWPFQDDQWARLAPDPQWALPTIPHHWATIWHADPI